MKKLFISQPMRGRTDVEILKERELLIEAAKREHGDVEPLDSFFKFDPGNGAPLAFLGESLKRLAEADIAVFAPGWENARGCRIEHICCEEYGIKIEDAVEEVSG